MWPIVRSTPDVRSGPPQTKKRKCGIQPAHQSLFTDVFGSRSLLCTIHRVIQLHASTRGGGFIARVVLDLGHQNGMNFSFGSLNEGATRQPVAGGERRLEYYRGVM